MSKWSSPNFYRYKCNNCGAPHRHRNHNKYPDLCESCAKSQAATDRHIAKMNAQNITSVFQKIRVDLAKISGHHEAETNV